MYKMLSQHSTNITVRTNMGISVNIGKKHCKVQCILTTYRLRHTKYTFPWLWYVCKNYCPNAREIKHTGVYENRMLRRIYIYICLFIYVGRVAQSV
jgi:hypothetical protein